jgi:hypothetical protein
VLAVLGLIVPLGLAGAVSPIMLTEQTVILAGPGGARAGLRFAAGALLALLVTVVAVMLFGRAISLPSEPKLDATLDLVLGLVLLAVAVAVRGRGEGGGEKKRQDRHARAAFPFGVFSMATNFTTLALVLPAAKEISTADVDVPERALLVLVVVVLAAIPAWMPVALVRIAPGPGARVLAVVEGAIDRHRRTAVVILLGAGGLFFAVRGIIRLAG